ncbi:uncharacterized protein LOC6541452 [Drosophila erecta]|uniref:Uncharacterized protein n=1 Tax=Drosophila erecta TaxID=7220 RepID=B3N8M6_DROER|nr:uncharacterized protein LOC6541452 [Drosophila erecta]EDV59503.1 uncharacterized protein Dere_GG23368 [Drosophila erecta]
MIYLQSCCCFVDLRIGTMAIGILHIIADILAGTFVALYGESGIPDLGHTLFLIFVMLHILSCVFLIIGCLRLRSSWMLFYIIMTMIMALAMIILIVSDVILVVWFWVMITYALMFFICLYFWLVAYSFYAALGGPLFI